MLLLETFAAVVGFWLFLSLVFFVFSTLTAVPTRSLAELEPDASLVARYMVASESAIPEQGDNDAALPLDRAA